MGGKRHYALLGKLLEKNRPEIAAELLSNYVTAETDYDKMNGYLEHFCKIKGANPKDSKHFVINHRREFICVMLHIYDPQVFIQPRDAIKIRYGFIRKISDIIFQDQGNTSRMTREVITLETVYDDFKEQVQVTLSELKAKGGDHGHS